MIFIVETMLVSCNLFCPCGCDSGPAKQIDIEGWNIQTIANNYQQVDLFTDLPFDQVYKSLSIDRWKVVFNEGSAFNSGYNAAYACSPAPLKASQTFESFRVISASEIAYLDANDVIEIGEDITNRFLITFFFDNTFKPIDDFINQLVIYQEDSYRVKLKDKPFQSTTLKFDFIITMSDGKVFEFRNEQLTVN